MNDLSRRFKTCIDIGYVVGNTGIGKLTLNVHVCLSSYASLWGSNGTLTIGQLLPQALLEHNAKVYLAARNQAKAEQAITEPKEATGGEAIFLDLSNLANVRRAAEESLRYVLWFGLNHLLLTVIKSKENELYIPFCRACNYCRLHVSLF